MSLTRAICLKLAILGLGFFRVYIILAFGVAFAFAFAFPLFLFVRQGKLERVNL